MTHLQKCECIQKHRYSISFHNGPLSQLRGKILQARKDAKKIGFDEDLVCCSEETFIKFIQQKK